jgi:hypothetical protein
MAWKGYTPWLCKYNDFSSYGVFGMDRLFGVSERDGLRAIARCNSIHPTVACFGHAAVGQVYR